MPLLLRLFVLLLLAVRLAGAGCDDPGVRIIEERSGNDVRLFVESVNCLDITLTLTTELVNMRSSPALPVTVDSRGRSRVELVRLTAANPAQKWKYHYNYQWRYGGRGGQPDGAAYTLPFAAPHRLMQGYRGRFSHQAGTPNEYALDWDMPEGTPVQAAREGTVVGIRQDSRSGGPDEVFKNCANYVIIRHRDGTYAEYLHLRPGGVRVRLGDQVSTGQPLAVSGNTGWSTRPHLHFAVFRTIDGSTRESLPVQFRVRDGSVQSLQEGKTY